MTLAELCQAALTVSDNTADNLIVASLGGPSAVTAIAGRSGDPARPHRNRVERGPPRRCPRHHDTGRDGGQSGRPGHRPQAIAPVRDQLAAWLVANQTGGAKLRAGLPSRWRVGDKIGSGGFGTSNDIAVIWPPDRKPLRLRLPDRHQGRFE